MSNTIKDVSRLSGLSISTISKYLNGGTVRKNNIAKIEKAIRELDYKVNQSARSLKTRKTMLVGIIVDSITNQFFSSIVSLTCEKLQERNYSSIICETNEDDEKVSYRFDFFMSKNVDGIIIISNCLSPDLLRSFTDRFKNIVVVDLVADNENCDFVVTDNVMGAFHATEQFIEKGHTRIAIIAGAEKHFSARERLTGYKQALLEHNIPINDSLIFKDAYDIKGGYRALKKLLEFKSADERPTAILVSSYLMMVGAIIAINENGVKVPDDFSIICFDNNELNMVFMPKLTCINQPIEEISETAVNFLIDRFAGKDNISRTTRLAPKILDGDSVKDIRDHVSDTGDDK